MIRTPLKSTTYWVPLKAQPAVLAYRLCRASADQRQLLEARTARGAAETN